MNIRYNQVAMKKSDNLKSIKYWGASTSAHQVEGGNHNQWSVWELENASELAKNAPAKYAHWLPSWDAVKDEATKPENYVSGIADDHYNRYEEDFDILSSLNMNAYRFSIEWSRIEPEEGKWDETEIEHYRKYLKALKKRKIEPFVTLWHWTMPVWFVEKGDFEKRSNVKYFVRYVEKIMEELGDLFTYVVTLNEPNTYVGMSYGINEWPPKDRGRIRLLPTYYNLTLAHKKSYKIIKKVSPKARVGIAQQISYFYNTDNGIISRIAVRAGMWSTNWIFFNRTKGHHDFFGLNYYQSNHMQGTQIKNTNKRQSDYGWNMQPWDIEQLLVDAHKKYGLPVVVLENGLADKNDKDRKWWLEETLGAMNRAIENGVKIDGYLHWSLLDNFEWADGFWPRFGLVEVDRKTLTRTVRPSAKWFAEQIREIRK